MNRSIFLAASIAMAACVLSTASPRTADAGGLGCCCFSCPDCRCKLTAEEVEVEKSCFEVECETICVPRVVFPWQTGKCRFPWSAWGKKNQCDSCDSCDGRGCKSCSNCVHNGAFLRTVKILKTKKYKCPECEYTWSADEAGNGCCDSACDGGCAASSGAGLPQTLNSTVSYRSTQSPGLGVVPVQGMQTSRPAGSGN